ncbi:hypothetical protein [Rhodopseudomonas palustris]|uniref:hypothetical protein n=1 Tax=Rhodopseudomonas palustris TaxID=1076 RepID=UPI000D229365|nr:hypothetical protein [Rhodopseudomonas palustris]AVT82493.1 hypothetical protein RPYSC3_36330 [Rhodopseudomonas palustris]
MNAADNGYSILSQIHTSRGMEYLGRKKLRSFTLNIFSMNKKELLDDLALFQNPQVGLTLMSEQYRDAGLQVHRELNRRFHNYLAAAKTLIDHTRAFVDDHYKTTDVAADYRRRVAEVFSENPICKFMQDIRNYTLHRELPISTMSLNFTPEHGIRTGVFIVVEQLKEWGGWTALSRQFLNSQHGEINPGQIVDTYSLIVEDFHSWLEDRLDTFHKADLLELECLEREYAEARNMRPSDSAA